MLTANETPTIEIKTPEITQAGIQLLVKRDDLNHPMVSGNKCWKLKYNLLEAKRQGKETLLTFGGAYSNHIYATAAAAKACGFKSIGLIRGEETLPLNKTLSFAQECGMSIQYLSREAYRQKEDVDNIKSLHETYGDFYLIPEGGTNDFALKGVMEFGSLLSAYNFDHLCIPVGTGGTIAGLIASVKGAKEILGFSSLKGEDTLTNTITQYVKNINPASHTPSPWSLNSSYHFGGYAKMTDQLYSFLNHFEKDNGFRLDPIYNGKMMYGIFNLIQQGYFPIGSTIMAIHTGGLQGWMGMQSRFARHKK